ncbi:protein arginine N-methyltransferase 1.6 [Citrus sinensis]|uniref:Protein arginine N-methyltransferase 1.6 n=1 Tax=Citrus sinensis TaxID=2711 RepID=A0ACB8LV80_CITSI|nr:protein arginine N-methyltransferase 1.6 [Citrus sinensis]
MFQLKLDPLTGNSEWVVIEENEDVPESSQEPLLATTSYLDMLNDSYRNRAYRLAIDKMVTKSCHVLDIGAGTGLLSMMAARAMGSSDSTTSLNTKGMVTACESYLPMVKLMKKVLHVNGMGRNIKVINKRSDELEVGVDIDSRADILVSEILDSELLGEGLIPTLQHAHDRLLVENPLTVPYRATTYGQFNLSIRGLLATWSLFNSEKLSEPFKIFEFDFWKRPDSHGETELQIKSTDDGRVHAVVSWWVLQLDREGTIFYSTAPRWISLPIHKSTGNWCDHWKQCVWFIPGKGMSICKGEELLFHALHTETSVSYELKSQIPITDERQHNLNAKDFQLALPPERIAIYGDGEWRLSMVMAMRNALQGRVQPLCVVADDSVFLTICVARLSKTAHVLSLLPGLGDKGAQYLRTVADPNCFSIDRVEILQKGKKCLTMDDTQQKKVDLLIGEPYYFGNDGMLPWQNLRFWKERSKLDPVLSKEVIIMPFKGILKACAIFCPDIWNSRRSLSKIEGFDHAVVNTSLGACGDLPAPKDGPCLPFFTWQCGEIKKLSNVFTVMEFDFSKPISPCQGKVQVEFTEPGLCHGFALWIDWVLDSENSIVISTGPDKRYWKQGVKLMAKPVAVGFEESGRTDLCSSTLVEASFDPSNGELNVQHTFS